MKQKGFVLVSVLIITTITTMLAFSQLKTNSLQERMAGNQQKEINARLAAEKGIFKGFDDIKSGGTTEQMLSDLNDFASDEDKDYSFSSLDSYGNNLFALVSTGKFGGATAHLKAVIKSPEGDAIIACESVNVSGNGSIEGDVTVIEGNATFSGNGSIAGYVTASGSVTGVPEDYYSVISRAELGECNPLGITGEIADMATQVTITPNDYATSTYTSFDGVNAAGGVAPVALDVLGQSKNVYVFNNFNTGQGAQKEVVITGDVTLYIKNNMTTKNTIFTLADNSSLTIFIEGKMDIETGSDIFSDQSVSAHGKAPLTVYSSNNTYDAVTLSGNGEIYMNLYAPLGTIAYNGNGNIMGALRGEVVDISGGGDIHYDQGLGEPASYCAIYYYYPENPGTVETLEAEDYRVYCGDDLDISPFISPFQSYAAIAGGYISIAANSTVNGDLAAQGYVSIYDNSVVHNIYAGGYVSTANPSTVENIYAGDYVTIGANAIAQNIHAGAAITVYANGDVQAVYAGAAITLSAGASTNGVLAEDANSDDYVEAGDIHNAGNMTEMITLITETQSALSDLVLSPSNGQLPPPTMGTRTLAPGVWEEDSALSITASSTITFDADKFTDNEDHVWVINLSGALKVSDSTNIKIIGLDKGDTATIIWNVGTALDLVADTSLDDTDTATIIWNVGTALTMGARTSFRGTAFVGGPITAATSSVSCGHLYATGLISIGSIGVDSAGSPVTCENSDAVFTYLETLN
ncbi:hypothetical protein Ping_3248 [Psychromonas ingrahamii 37]|uniref:Uncharacterized protein n=1 Tax=Psychromonas ingrahamii (strain DSM 17664 / CCUG 51855 / 37) TaxID=357804 RepID=A1SZM0_PSYIN|nr:ice-binding family protein [Psychromonas ingrahamii]ABM04935.1 hypothetical protein Ping_3248 [Psychromonas ingrahamii 37]